jgi:hypothetical protein
MICAIEFGSCWIRALYRNSATPQRLMLFSEPAEYVLLANNESHRSLLQTRQIPFAVCDDALLVTGHAMDRAEWLSRLPRTPLFPEGNVPDSDPPARQLLNVIVESILPPGDGSNDLCVLTVPGRRDHSDTAIRNEEFLNRLLQMRGYRTCIINAAEATLLAGGNRSAFTGFSVVIGAETTSICFGRQGVSLAAETLKIGANWIDTELARHFHIHRWDDEGQSYLDLHSVRQWKQGDHSQHKNLVDNGSRMLLRLYAVVLEQVARTMSRMLSQLHSSVASSANRIPVLLAGGGTLVGDFPGLLTQRLDDHGLSDRILSVQQIDDPCTAVVRGGLILAELEHARTRVCDAA